MSMYEYARVCVTTEYGMSITEYEYVSMIHHNIVARCDLFSGVHLGRVLLRTTRAEDPLQSGFSPRQDLSRYSPEPGDGGHPHHSQEEDPKHI